eukprot:GHVU01009095.1.p2 GENE.GHVU01009095.1~~GHVU01009095.1.p2  ORF type:complete len:174 (+),score=35.73 GHVU01009095.1:1344-1865(+)
MKKKTQIERDRPIFIDGANVARGHPQGGVYYSYLHIFNAVKFFIDREFTDVLVVVKERHLKDAEKRLRLSNDVVPTWEDCSKACPDNSLILLRLEEHDHLIVLPFDVDGSDGDDDFAILSIAAETEGAVVVSNDKFKEYRHNGPAFENFLLMPFTGSEDGQFCPKDMSLLPEQ